MAVFMDMVDEIVKDKIPGFVPGEAITIMPENAYISLNITTPLGKASAIAMGLVFLLRKDGFKTERIEEAMEVSPVHAQYYALTMKQKEELEARIKTILASLSAAVADLELLEHDLRKYREFMRHFELMEEGIKEKNVEKIRRADSTLRSIFIDQVDVHTGPGIALKLITEKWPTVIVDFMKLTDEDVEAGAIAKKLGISPAEATILATKNKLYLEWRDMFKTTVQERYRRILSLVESKKKSIEELKASARPVLLRYKSIREIGETREGRELLIRLSWLRPAGMAVSIEISKLWAWKTFVPPEFYMPTTEVKKVRRKIARVRKIPREFKEWLKAEIGPEEYRKKEVTVPPFGIEPLDRWALYLIKELQNFYKRYGVEIKFTAEELLNLREELVSELVEPPPKGVFPPSPYFVVNEIGTERVILRFPDGTELEDLTFNLRTKLESMNLLLVRYAEMKAKNKMIENYIDELLGEMSKGRPIEELLRREFPALKGVPRVEVKPKVLKPPFTLFGKIQRIFPIVRPGPYEKVFFDRITKMYLAEISRRSFARYVGYLKKSVGVP